MEACIKCRERTEKRVKEEIIDEIKDFLEKPNDFYVLFNPITRFYKFERIK